MNMPPAESARTRARWCERGTRSPFLNPGVVALRFCRCLETVLGCPGATDRFVGPLRSRGALWARLPLAWIDVHPRGRIAAQRVAHGDVGGWRQRGRRGHVPGHGVRGAHRTVGPPGPGD